MMGFPKPQSRAAEKKADTREKETRWQKVRREVLFRDGYKCRLCGDSKLVDVHHLRPRSLGREDSTANCLVLCRIHHADRHAGRLFIRGADANHALYFEQP